MTAKSSEPARTCKAAKLNKHSKNEKAACTRFFKNGIAVAEIAQMATKIYTKMVPRVIDWALEGYLVWV